jgi:hypothetical protein
MAYNLSDSRTISFQTSADLSASQFCFVKLDATSGLTIAGKNSYALGILENQPSATPGGQYAATVAIDGVARLCVGAAYAIGTFLCPGTSGDGTGIGLNITDSSSNLKYARAMQMQTSTAPGDVVAVRLIGPQPGMDSDGTAI